MRCIDCHWFKKAPPAGRESKPCSELGEVASNAACDRFTEFVYEHDPPPELKKLSSKELEGVLGALCGQKYHEIFGEIIAEEFVLDQNLDHALKKPSAQLQQQGASITADFGDLKRTANKMISLYRTYRLATALGLGAFVDQIMTAEIEKNFRYHGKED